jgi:hypothetical protein
MLLFAFLIPLAVVVAGCNLQTPNIEEQIYAQIKRDGGLADSAFPFLLYVKKVEGSKLRGVEIMRYDSSRKKFDLIGRADALELRIDSVHRKLLLDLRDFETRSSDGTMMWMESRICELDLSANLGKGKAEKLPKKEDLPLSAEDRKFLEEGIPNRSGPSTVDEKLKQAFGADCKELGRPLRLYLPSFNLVLSAGTFEKKPAGQYRYSSCSIAHFRKQPNGEYVPQLTLRDSELISNLQWPKLTEEHKTITFECPDGTHVSFKAN